MFGHVTGHVVLMQVRDHVMSHVLLSQGHVPVSQGYMGQSSSSLFGYSWASVAAAPRAGASWSRASTSRPGQLVELSQAVGTGTLS